MQFVGSEGLLSESTQQICSNRFFHNGVTLAGSNLAHSQACLLKWENCYMPVLEQSLRRQSYDTEKLHASRRGPNTLSSASCCSTALELACD